MTQGYGPDHGQQPQWGQGGQDQPPPAAQPQWGQPEQEAPAPQPQWGQPPQGAPAPQEQWGQPSPAPQPEWGQPSPAQQPQWGQASPVPAPGGYPGSTGYPGASGSSQFGSPQFASADGANWRRVKLLGLILLIGTAVLLLVRLGINLTTFIGAAEIAASNTGATPGALGIGTGLAALVLFIANALVSLVMLVLGIVAAVMGRGRARVGGIVVAAAIPVAVVLYWILSFVMAFVLIATGVVDPVTAELTASSYRITSGVDAVRTVLMVAVIGLGSYFVYTTAVKKLSA